MEGAFDAGLLLALLFKFNFFGDINFSVMECLIFSALITTTGVGLLQAVGRSDVGDDHVGGVCYL